MAVFTLLASQTPAVQVPATYMDPALGTPTTSPAFPALTSASAIGSKLRELSAGVDALGRVGSGGYGVAFGLELTVSSGLTLAISAGQALLDATVERAASTVVLSDNIARIYLWLGQNGTVTQVNNSLTPPAGAQVFLGSCVTSGGAITEIDYSGRVQCLRGGLWTRYADLAAPANTPPSSVTFDALTAGGLYHWDGTAWVAYGGAVSADLSNTSDPAKGDALVGYKAPLPGSTARTVHARFADMFVSVKDFGAVGDGLTVDGPACQAAITNCPAGGTVYFPPGVYLITASSTWTHTRGAVSVTKNGLVVTNKRINIVGAGMGTILRAGAASVDVLTYYSTDGAAAESRSSFTTVSDLQVDNPGAFATCNGIVYDRAYRNRLHRCRIGNPSGTHFVAGVKLINSFIWNGLDTYIYNCTTGVDANNFYRDSDGQLADASNATVSGANGPNHAFTWQGAEIAGCGIGIDLIRAILCSIHDTTIEGCTTAGVRARGVTGLTLAGIYWENASPANDLDLSASPFAGSDPCRPVWAENVSRIKARNTSSITLANFRELRVGQGGNFDVDTTVGEVTFLNPWWTEDVSSDCRAQIWAHFNRGLANIVSQGMAKTNAVPLPDLGQNLVPNLAFPNSANSTGWTFTTMAVQTAGAPFGTTRCAQTSGATNSAVCVMVAPFTNDLRGRAVSLSLWVKIPNTIWTGNLQLVDGDGDRALQFDNAVKDGAWYRVSGVFRIGAAATGLTMRVNLTSNGGAGNAQIAGPTMALGHIPLQAAMDEHLLAPAFQERRPQVRATVSLTAASQIDPTAGRVQRVVGSGAVTLTSAPVINPTPTWFDGMRVTLIGNSGASTVTLTDGGTTKLKLGAATRVLDDLRGIELMYVKERDLWVEQNYGFAAAAGANTDLTRLSGLGDGTAGAPALTFSADTNTGIYRIGADILGLAAGGAEGLRAAFDGTRVLFGMGGATAALVKLLITAMADTINPLALKRNSATQTANLLRFLDETGAELSAVGPMGGFMAPDGVVGTPGVRFLADTNLGLYRIGADILGVSANGVEQARFSTAGLLVAADVDAAGGFRQTIDGWWADDIPGTAGPTVMTRFGAGAAFPTAWIAPRAGSITAVIVKSNDARTAGTATVEVFKNGTGVGLTAVLDGTNVSVKATTQAKDTDAFVAGDVLDIRLTTAGWTPITADIRAAIEVET